jgi:hypothetical protein
MAIMPFRIVGPSAVIRFTFLITSAGAALRTYVLGNGLAFGSDTPPGPVAPAESFAAAGVGGCAGFAGLHAVAVTRTAAMSK